MKLLKLLVVGMLVFGVQVNTHAEGVYFGSGLGGGDLEIEQDFLPGLTQSLTDTDGALIIDLFTGYEFSNGLFVDLSFEVYTNVGFLNFVDQVDVSSARLGIGYVFPSESRFKFYGKTGIGFWEVGLSEGIFLNPGPEESFDRSGEDPFVQIGTNYYFNPRTSLGLNYSYSDTEFGETSGVKIDFKWFPWGDNIN